MIAVGIDAVAASPSIDANTNNSSSPLHQSHQHLFQHQSSVTSTASIQTVFHQSVIHNNNSNFAGNCNGTGATANFQNGCHLTSSSGSVTCLVGNSGGVHMQQMHNQMVNSSNPSIAEEALSIGDVADLLHPQYAIITGGRSNDGCSLITFPDHNNFHGLADSDYQKLILYLTSVPS